MSDESSDAVTVEQLLREGAALQALGRSLLGDAVLADDLVQEAYRVALERQRPVRRLGPWLTGVTRRLARMWLRAEERRERRERNAARPEALPSAADAAATAELLRRLAEAVHALEEPYRTAIVLRYWYGLMPRQLAARLGVPLNTVRSRLQRGLGCLRARLDRGRGRDAWSGPLAVLLHTRNRILTEGAALMGIKGWSAATVAVVLGALALYSSVLPLRVEPQSSEVHDGRAAEARGLDAPGPSETAHARSGRRRVAAADATFPVEVVVAGTSVRVSGATLSVCDTQALGAALRAAGTELHMPRGRRIEEELTRTVATTDSRGRADVPWIGGQLSLAARKGGLWGWTFLNARPRSVVSLEVAVDQRLEVQTLSPSGTPQPDVPVSLRKRDTASVTNYTDKTTASEPPSGIAVFEHVQRRFQLMGAEGWHVTWGFPSLPETRAWVSESDTRGPPVPLTVPPSGTIDLAMRDASGKPVHGDDVTLRLSATPEPDSEAAVWAPRLWTERHPDTHGNVHVPWIGIGLYVKVEVQVRDVTAVAETFPGPTVAGDRVQRALTVPASSPTVTGRFVTPDGRPCTPARVEGRMHLETGEWVPVAVSLGSAGEFEVGVDADLTGSKTLELSAVLDGQRVLASRTLPEPRWSGPTSIGDVTLDLGTFLVSGRVTDVTGHGLEDCSLLVSEPFGERQWHGVQTAGTLVTRADGTFSLYWPEGTSGVPRTLRLRVAKHDYAPAAIAFEPGSVDLLVVLDRGGVLEGSVLLRPGENGRDYIAHVSAAGRGRSCWVKSDGAFRCEDLPAGRYDVVVRLRDVDGPGTSVEVEGVEVAQGRVCRDPRLQMLTLGGNAVAMIIEVLDEVTGLAVEDAEIEWRTQAARGSARTRSDGIARLALQAWPTSLTVRAVGYRDTEVHDIRDRVKLRMTRGIPLTVATDISIGGRRGEHRIGVRITGERSKGATRAPSPRESTWYFDVGQRIDVRLPAPGTYAITPVVWVRRPNAGIVVPIPDRGISVEVTEGASEEVRVSAGAAQIERAIETGLRTMEDK